MIEFYLERPAQWLVFFNGGYSVFLVLRILEDMLKNHPNFS